MKQWNKCGTCAHLHCVPGDADGKCSLPRPSSTWMRTIQNSSTPKCCVNWSDDAVAVVFSYWNRNRRSPSIRVTRIQYYNHARRNCLLLYVRYVLLVSFDLLALWMPFSVNPYCLPIAGWQMLAEWNVFDWNSLCASACRVKFSHQSGPTWFLGSSTVKVPNRMCLFESVLPFYPNTIKLTHSTVCHYLQHVKLNKRSAFKCEMHSKRRVESHYNENAIKTEQIRWVSFAL